jgi:assimilatory nitrate reductase catalytic subunit
MNETNALHLPPNEVKTVCCYCGVGCGVIVQTDGGQITGVRGDPDHPANFGRLCSKGSTLHLTAAPLLQQQVRALQPELRRPGDSERSPASWEETLDHISERMAQCIEEHGPDSVGFYISGQLLTEDYYLFNKLAKGLIGTNNIDTNSRLCMSSAVAGYKQTLGADAPPACYEDFDLADLIFIVGSNTAYAHPILYRRIEAARAANPNLKVIVADPRRTDTARDADLFLPILPGSDVALFNGMLHLCLWDGHINSQYIAEHTEGFAQLRESLRDCTPALTARICGISEEDLVQAARWFGQSKAALSLYCQGLNQSSSGTAKNVALINLHLATAQIGRPGAGPFSLTGQPNAMGGREVGGMANLLSGHRDLANPAHRAEVAQLWGVESVPAKPGKTAVELFEAVRKGEIKILWIACTNPAQSMPEQALVRAALEKAELVIVQEAYRNTVTVDYAHVLLPASTWGEKDGTVTNSERRISRVRAALPPPGQARHDWQIVIDCARRLETRLGRAHSLFSYDGPEEVWNEHRASTGGRDLDITGLSWDILEQQGPQQWPYPVGASSGRKRLYEDGVYPTANGRARFVPTQWQPLADTVDARYPFHLNTGRLRDQWHGMSRTGTVGQLFAHGGEPAIVMAASDLALRLLRPGDLVHVSSRRGSQIFPVAEGDDMRGGQTFIAMHWGQEFVSGRGRGGAGSHGVNALTSPALDPDSRQPELKHAAVRIMKAELPWRLLAMAWAAPDQVLLLQQRLRQVLPQFAYAALTLFGRERCGVMLRAANEDAVDATVLRKLEGLLELDGPQVLRYDDARHGKLRRLRVQDEHLQAMLLVGDLAAEGWLKETLQGEQSVQALGRLLLMSSSRAPSGTVTRGRIVCNCLNVSESEIQACLAKPADGNAQATLTGLQQQLKCGTQCGSCIPELKRMCAQTSPSIA